MKFSDIIKLNEQTSSYEQLKAEWSKVNSDEDTSTKGFGEATSFREDIAKSQAQFRGRLIVAKKAAGIKPSENKPFDTSIGASEINGKTYEMNGKYTYICLMDKN